MNARQVSPKTSKHDPYDLRCCGVENLGYQIEDVTLPADSRPGPIAVTRDGSAVYAVNANDTVSVIDVNALSLIDNLPTGANPLGIAMHPTDDRAYVANFGDRSVSVYNTANHSSFGPPIQVQSGSTVIQPASLAVSADGTRLFVNSDTWFAPGGLAWIDLAGPTTHIIEPPAMVISGIAGLNLPRNPFGTATVASDSGKFFATHRFNLGDRAIRLADSASNSFVSFQVDLLPCALLQRDDTLVVTGYKTAGPEAEDLGIDVFRQSDLLHLQHLDVPGVAAQLMPGDPIPIEGFGFNLRAAALDVSCSELWYGNPGDGLSLGHVGIVNLESGQFRTFAVEDCNGIAFTPDGRLAFLSDRKNDRIIRLRVH